MSRCAPGKGPRSLTASGAPRRRAARLALAAAGLALAAAAPAAAASTEVSSNWAGYVATRPNGAAPFARVAGSWVEPSATCTPGADSYSAEWVGLGGYASDSKALEQTGTAVDCDRAGRAFYSVWYELVPAAPVTVKLTLAAGDHIAASVAVHGQRVILQVRDLTSAKSDTVVRSIAQPDVRSAEWILEAPSECLDLDRCQTLPLADFGTITFTDAKASTVFGHTGPISDPHYLATPLDLSEEASGPHPRHAIDAATLASADVSPLSATGNSFTVTWQPATPSTSPVSEGSPPTLPAGTQPP